MDQNLEYQQGNMFPPIAEDELGRMTVDWLAIQEYATRLHQTRRTCDFGDCFVSPCHRIACDEIPDWLLLHGQIIKPAEDIVINGFFCAPVSLFPVLQSTADRNRGMVHARFLHNGHSMYPLLGVVNGYFPTIDPKVMIYLHLFEARPNPEIVF